MAHIVIDFETQSACDLTRSGAWVYSEHPTTTVLCLGYRLADGSVRLWTPDQPAPQSLFDDIEAGAVVVAHNCTFEKAIWKNVMRRQFDWPDISTRRWTDTMAVCAHKALPLKLEEAARVLGLAHEKDMTGHRAMRQLSIANKKTGEWKDTPELRQTVYDYCLDDIRAEEDLLNAVRSLPKAEHQVWELDQKINERGIRLDMDFITKSQKILDDTLPGVEAEFMRLSGGVKSTQVAKVRDWFLTQGVFLPDMRQETVEDLLNSDAVLPEIATKAFALRQQLKSASVKKLRAMRECVCSDGRARALIQYHAATTGRFAGRLLMPHNFPRGTVELGKDEDGNPVLSPDVLVPLIKSGDANLLADVFGSPVDVVSSGLRHALVPDKGNVFHAFDFMTIEARIVLALAGQFDKVQLIQSGVDIYCDMAQSIYKKPINKKEHPKERQTGKNSVLGLGFQMGPSKFKLRYAKDETMEFAKHVVDTYRQEFAPKVPELWYAIDEAATKCVWDKAPTETHGLRFQLEGGWMTMRLHSGRKLYYWSPMPVKRRMPWDENDVRQGWRFMAKKGGRWNIVDAYGGLLTENAVQAIARDALCDRMLALDAEGHDIVLTVHDEIVVEAAENSDNIAIEQIMLERSDWLKNLGVPISVEPWSGDCYRK